MQAALTSPAAAKGPAHKTEKTKLEGTESALAGTCPWTAGRRGSHQLHQPVLGIHTVGRRGAPGAESGFASESHSKDLPPPAPPGPAGAEHFTGVRKEERERANVGS